MPRSNRDTTPGVFHVFSHSVRSTPLFHDDLDRMEFLRELARATARAPWRCVAFCVMTTHYHLILDVGEGVLPKGMHQLNFRYARGFNIRHGLRGHVFEARYECRRISSDEHLLTVFRYVARNPAKARLCSSPRVWPWSSYAHLVEGGPATSFVDPSSVLLCFGDADNAVRRLQAFVENA